MLVMRKILDAKRGPVRSSNNNGMGCLVGGSESGMFLVGCSPGALCSRTEKIKLYA